MKKLILFLSLTVSLCSFGTTKTSVATGLWSDPNIWSPVGVPSAMDDTVIIASYVVFYAQNINCAASYLGITANGTLYSGAAAGSVTFTGDVFINNGSISGSTLVINAADSAVNNGIISIKHLTQTGLFINRQVICVQNDFTSDDSLINNGEIGCGSWMNMANVTGNQGQFCISQDFANSGQISGMLDICDASPSSPGDSNTGTISGSVTTCAVGPCNVCSGVSIVEYFAGVEISVAPNPVTEVARVTLETDQLQPNAQLLFTLTDAQGRIVKTIPFSGTSLLFDRSGIESGLYFYTVILQDASVVSGKLLVD